VLGEDLLKARHELRQVTGLHAGVLHEGDGLLVPLHAEEEAEPGLAELPDGLLLAGVQGHGRRVAEVLALAQGLQGLDLRAHLGLAVPRVLHDEDGLGVALHEAHPLRLLEVAAGEIEDHLVRQLDGVRARLEDGLGGLQGLQHVAIVDDRDRGGPGTAAEPHLGLEDGDEGALRADDEPRHVEPARPRLRRCGPASRMAEHRALRTGEQLGEL
jgi:hypothetical protein